MTETLTDATEGARSRLERVCKRIAEAAARAGRNPAEITLVAVSKRQSTSQVAAGILAGIVEIGENYVQEAQGKQTDLAKAVGQSAVEGLRWHMIGHLQQNKAATAAQLFDTVHSVDRPKLAQALDRHAGACGRRLDILLQVNLSGESQKSGAQVTDLAALADACAPLPHLRLTGLMTMPAANADPGASRPAFRRLRELRDDLQQREGGETLRDLSMGMSADFEVAVEEGATLVRVGTALFGPREDAP